MIESWRQREINKCEDLLKRGKLRDIERIGLIAYLKNLSEEENAKN